MRSRRTIITISVLGIIAAIAVFGFYTTTQYSCLECRATLENRWVLGVPSHWVTQNSYSEHVLSQNSAHQHQWRWCGTDLSYSLTSFIRACGRRHPIWQLPVSVQADYARLVSPGELHKTLQTIDSADGATAEATVQRVYETVLNSR